MQNDIDKLLGFLNGISMDTELFSNITNFSNIDAVYRWTNEALRLYPQNNLENKKVLAITSSGDHALDAVLNGALDIDCLDINEFSKYVSSLKIAMIKAYDYKNFKEKYELFTNVHKEGLSSYMKILDDISIYLMSDERRFWFIYGKWLEKNHLIHYGQYLFRNDKNCFIENNRYYDKNNYNILKERLDGVSIKYHDGDIIDVTNILNGNMYDAVYLSNIIARINTYLDIEFLMKNMLEITNKEGLIYNYFFNHNVDLKKMFQNCILEFDDMLDITTKESKIKVSDFKSIKASVVVFKK